MKVVISAILLGILLIGDVHAMMGGIGRKKSKAPPVKSDIKYIRCQVCEAIAKEAYRKVREMQSEQRPGRHVKEIQVVEYVEQMCNADVEEGAWITRYDLVEEGDKLKLVDQGGFGHCETECRTIEAACEQILGDHDTDLAEYLAVTNSKDALTRAKVQNELCYGEITEVCEKKVPKVPASREPGPPFKPMTDEDRKMKTLMAQMEAQGLSGQMLDTQNMDMQAMMDYYGYGDDYDEDFDEDASYGDYEEPMASAHMGAPNPDSIEDSLLDKAVQAGSKVAAEAVKMGTLAADKIKGLAKKGADMVEGLMKGGHETANEDL